MGAECVAPCIANDVSYVTRIKDESVVVGDVGGPRLSLDAV